LAGPARAAEDAASVSPSSGLKDGQTVTVTGSGWPANDTINMVECSVPLTAVSSCDLGTLVRITSSATGTFSTPFRVHTGVVGDGSCDPGKSCLIAIGNTDNSSAAQVSIAFAPAATPSPTAKPSPVASTGSGEGEADATSDVPTTVNAGSGGEAGRSGAPTWLVGSLSGLGVLLVGAGLRRRLVRE
jgi:hypothetical protein